MPRRLSDFWSNVDQSGGPDACWPWTGTKDRLGYGRRRHAGRHALAHRVAYELAVGPIPPRLNVCHRCDVRHCCNPRHLFGGTQIENIADRDAKRRQAQGEGNGRAKLTRLEVEEIRRLYVPNRYGYPRLARQFGVTEATIVAIIKRRTWR